MYELHAAGSSDRNSERVGPSAAFDAAISQRCRAAGGDQACPDA